MGGGFTLIEMLIVVAIIAILIAISIPLVNNALEKARDATDDANFRSAAALGNIMLLTEDTTPTGTYYYITTDSAQGKLDTDKTGAYESQCKATGSDTHGVTKTSSGKIIQVTFTADTVTVAWVDKGTTSP